MKTDQKRKAVSRPMSRSELLISDLHNQLINGTGWVTHDPSKKSRIVLEFNTHSSADACYAILGIIRDNDGRTMP